LPLFWSPHWLSLTCSRPEWFDKKNEASKPPMQPPHLRHRLIHDILLKLCQRRITIMFHTLRNTRRSFIQLFSNESGFCQVGFDYVSAANSLWELRAAAWWNNAASYLWFLREYKLVTQSKGAVNMLWVFLTGGHGRLTRRSGGWRNIRTENDRLSYTVRFWLPENSTRTFLTIMPTLFIETWRIRPQEIPYDAGIGAD